MGHWYDKDGEPRHKEGKDGGDTTLREARKLGLYPSVTTIGGILHKEGLVYWLQKQAAIAAIEMCKDVAELLEVFDDDSAAQAIAKAKEEKVTAKADEGTVIHDMLENFHDDPFNVTGDDQRICYAILECIKENTGLNLFEDFIPEARFCDTEHGYAGMCDLHTKPEVTTPWVLDYKTKDKVNDKTTGYKDHGKQLAAYSHGLRLPDARLGNIFISRQAPEDPDVLWDVKFYEHKNVQYLWACFLDTLHCWQMDKKFGAWYEAWKEKEDE